MPKVPTTTVTLGDLVAAAYACAGIVARDQKTAAALAAGTVGRRLARAARNDLARRLAARPIAAVSPLHVSHARAA
jgi:hypothetical protein